MRSVARMVGTPEIGSLWLKYLIFKNWKHFIRTYESDNVLIKH